MSTNVPIRRTDGRRPLACTLLHFENGQHEAFEYWQTPYGEVRIGSCSAPTWPDGITEEETAEVLDALRIHPDSQID